MISREEAGDYCFHQERQGTEEEEQRAQFVSEAVWENVRFQMLRAKALLSGDSAPGLAAGRELWVGSCHFLQMNVVLTKPPFAHALENHRWKRKKKSVMSALI